MNSFSRIKVIAKRELLEYYVSPIAYIFLITFLMLNGFFTFMVGAFFERGEASLQPFFQWHPWLYLFLVPAIGMHIWAEERRSGTIEFLFTLPVTRTQTVIGKFLASWLFLAFALFLTFPIVITVGYLGEPDYGIIFSGYLGSLLMMGAFLSITVMTSAMTKNQVVSFIISVVVCLFLILAGWPPVTRMVIDWAPNWLVDSVVAFSVMPHFEAMQRGVVDSRDLLYYVSVIVFCLFSTSVILKSK
ncbi:MAG: ABC transporter permease subunit [Verrucomicrobiota bacterium]|nr:ABC transporter permease subunit [Verrucomicrobiota bacterium]